MKRTIFFAAGLGFALSAAAAPNGAVHCGANEERVWVYENLTSFDVGARLKCGDTVALLSVQKDYVKVRTATGYEGYVAAKALPPEEVAALAPPAAVAPAPAPVAAAPVAVIPAAPVPQSTALAAKPAPAATQAAASALTAAPVIASSPVWIAPQPTAAAPTPIVAAIAPAVPAPAPARTPAPSLSATSAVARVAAARPSPKPAPAPAPAKDEATLVIEPVATSISITATAAPQPAMLKAADVRSSVILRPAMGEGPRRSAAFADEEEDLPEVEAPAKEDLSSCSVFFSAYGLTPDQLRWFAASRRKQFPGVCPAPSPSMVDYVVIFTHDNNFYTASMPEPVHTDKNGFSDWSPVTPVDDTLVPTADLDKSRHEYAWVFRFHRGSFDPANFSGKRKPQFAKTDHGSAKAAADALQFMAQGRVTQ